MSRSRSMFDMDNWLLFFILIEITLSESAISLFSPRVTSRSTGETVRVRLLSIVFREVSEGLYTILVRTE